MFPAECSGAGRLVELTAVGVRTVDDATHATRPELPQKGHPGQRENYQAGRKHGVPNEVTCNLKEMAREYTEGWAEARVSEARICSIALNGKAVVDEDKKKDAATGERDATLSSIARVGVGPRRSAFVPPSFTLFA